MKSVIFHPPLQKRTRKTRVKENRKITDFIHIADPGGPEQEPGRCFTDG
jgi:hypothetical protein